MRHKVVREYSKIKSNHKAINEIMARNHEINERGERRLSFLCEWSWLESGKPAFRNLQQKSVGMNKSYYSARLLLKQTLPHSPPSRSSSELDIFSCPSLLEETIILYLS